MDPGSYVADLHKSLETIHNKVREHLEAEIDVRLARAERSAGPSAALKVGDKVFLRMPPEKLGDEGVSRRLRPRARPQLLEVDKFVSAQAVVLKDPDTHSRELGFAQPVAVSRLIKHDMHELEEPVSRGPLRLELRRGSQWVPAKVVQQNATGAVVLEMEDGSDQPRMATCRLDDEEYRWLA